MPKLVDTGGISHPLPCDEHCSCIHIQTFRAFSTPKLTRIAPTHGLISSACRRIQAQHGAISRDVKPIAGIGTERSSRCRCDQDEAEMTTQTDEAGANRVAILLLSLPV
jgi:hypothetical protein